MVFYGRKVNISQRSIQQYRSIRQQILGELGQRNPPVVQTSMQSIFTFMGSSILNLTQNILLIPQNFKQSTLYQLYQNDKQVFKQQFQPIRKDYRSLASIITQNKFDFIQHYSLENRMIFLNGLTFAAGIINIFNKRISFTKITRLLQVSATTYLFGGLLVVPEIYYPFLAHNLI